MPKCKCGCNREIPYISKKRRPQNFIRGHNSNGSNNPFYGKRHSEYSKNKNRESKINGYKNGLAPFNKNKKYRITPHLIMDDAGIDKRSWRYGIVNCTLWGYNRFRSLRGRSAWNKGKKLGYIPVGAFKKGHIPWCRDKNRPEISGEKHPSWNGGSSFLPYSKDFNKNLKNEVKKRFSNRCLLCGCNKKLSIHHIDYDKSNTSISNLVPLCNSCHTKTNFNRIYWEKEFKEILEVSNGIFVN